VCEWVYSHEPRRRRKAFELSLSDFLDERTCTFNFSYIIVPTDAARWVVYLYQEQRATIANVHLVFASHLAAYSTEYEFGLPSAASALTIASATARIVRRWEAGC
jgi:hypothetical protein